jgi:hypothetical protein
MKRIHNRSRYAAMLSSQLVERRNSNRIAKNDSDLPAFITQCGLTLRSSFWLGHWSTFRSKQLATMLGMDGFGAGLIEPERNAVSVNVNPFTGSGGKHYLRQFIGNIRGVRIGRASIHIYLRSREILPMCESYSVTSDVSTGRAG